MYGKAVDQLKEEIRLYELSEAHLAAFLAMKSIAKDEYVAQIEGFITQQQDVFDVHRANIIKLANQI